MITRLNIPAPPARQLQRVNLIELVAPVVAAERYFGVIRRREGESAVCAVVHPYRTAHLYATAFPVLLPLLLAEVCPDLQMSEATWADIAYTSPDTARPQLLVRTTRLDSAAAEVVWQDRDQSYARSWASRVWPIVHLLDRIRPDQPGLNSSNVDLPAGSSAAPAHLEGGPDGR
jgi:hypothetical protein